MNDLTILFYTCNRVEEPFASRVRSHLLNVIGDTPLVSVTHKPLRFGENICVGPLPVSAYSVYKQILFGAALAQTEYVACAEDDTLYTPSHFTLRPPDAETFGYNKFRYWCEESGVFRLRDRSGMHCCIAPRRLLIDTLEKRFEKYPAHPKTREGLTGWGEPGRLEWYLKLPKVKMEYLWSDEPVVTFNRKGSLGGLRKTNPTDEIVETLEPWGSARRLWDSFHL